MTLLRNIGVAAGVVTFVVDQVSKWLVVHALDLINLQIIQIFPPLLTFRMGWNRGINFGLFAGDADTLRWVLIALSLGISIWVIWWLSRTPQNSKLVQISGGLLVGGALGNVVDRLIYGAVADFINMSCCGINNPFVFNVADVAIFAGAVGLVFFTPDAPRKSR